MSSKSSYTEYLNRVETFLDEYLGEKAPPIPENIQYAIVQFLPWVVILMIIYSASYVMNIFRYAVFYSPAVIVVAILTIVIIILRAIAVPQLLKKTEKGWRNMYYSVLVGAVAALFGPNFIMDLVLTLIFLYVLFQIKNQYN